jgi:hypothetical protein
MADNLIPTVITDKNGRVTTVRKRQDAGTKGSKALGGATPSIAREAPADRHAATPLVPPRPLTKDEVAKFDDKYFEVLSNTALDGGPTSRDVFIYQLDGVSQAQVREALDEGAVSVASLDRLLFQYREAIRTHSVFSPRMPKEEAVSKLQTSLLLARKLGREFPALTPSDGAVQGVLINDAIIGYSYSAKVADRPAYTDVSTEEELESLTAVTALMLEGYRQLGYGSSFFKGAVFEVSNGEDREGRFLINRTLDKFLRENPHEAHRVIAYAKDRDIGTTAKDTAKVIRHLQETEELGAVSDGWL